MEWDVPQFGEFHVESVHKLRKSPVATESMQRPLGMQVSSFPGLGVVVRFVAQHTMQLLVFWQADERCFGEVEACADSLLCTP